MLYNKSFKKQYEYPTVSLCTPMKHMEEMVHTALFTRTGDPMIRPAHCVRDEYAWYDMKNTVGG
jgi:hypothetical protein